MFKKLMKNKKAQQTAEYALLISLVVAAVIAMQTYAQRSIQAKIKGASDYLTTDQNVITSQEQYEPYYLKTSYNVARTDRTSDFHQINSSAMGSNSIRDRAKGGFQEQSYNAAQF